MENNKSEEKLLSDLVNGDASAFEHIYTRWRDPVRYLLLKITRSEQDAEDITQDVFVNLWNFRGRIDPTKNIKTLIFLFARQSAIRMSYRSRLHDSCIENQQSLESDFTPNPHELLVVDEMKLLTDYIIERMPAKQKEVFILHYRENLSNKEIADRLALSPENVRKHINNAKKHLKEMIALVAVLFLS